MARRVSGDILSARVVNKGSTGSAFMGVAEKGASALAGAAEVDSAREYAKALDGTSNIDVIV